MPAGGWCVAALFAMETCPPGAVLDALAEVLANRLDAWDVELLVVDYGLRVLRVVAPPGSAARSGEQAVEGSVAGRAFTSGRLTTGGMGSAGVVVHVPVTVRGDRLGVLRLRLPAPPDPGLREELSRLGVVVGHGLAAANRDTDVFEQAARRERLSLAAELQWELLPGRYCTGAEFALAGQLEPAYLVRGDNFDWSCAADHLQLTVSNGVGEGVAASLLTHLAVVALRNARRAGLGLSDQARLADQAVYAHHHGALSVSTLLLEFNFAAGRAWAVHAGSPVLFRQQGPELERVELTEQLPLGMFDGTPYTREEFPIARGDRLLVVTDGVYDAVARAGGATFSDVELPRLAAATRALPPLDVVRTIVDELRTHQSDQLEDDAVIVCLDWTGRDHRPS